MNQVTSASRPGNWERLAPGLALLICAVARLPALILGVEHYGDAPVRVEVAQRWLLAPHLFRGFCGDLPVRPAPLDDARRRACASTPNRLISPRLLSFAFALLGVWILYWLARQVTSTVGALLAATLLSLDTVHIQSGSSGRLGGDLPRDAARHRRAGLRRARSFACQSIWRAAPRFALRRPPPRPRQPRALRRPHLRRADLPPGSPRSHRRDPRCGFPPKSKVQSPKPKPARLKALALFTRSAALLPIYVVRARTSSTSAMRSRRSTMSISITARSPIRGCAGSVQSATGSTASSTGR